MKLTNLGLHKNILSILESRKAIEENNGIMEKTQKENQRLLDQVLEKDLSFKILQQQVRNCLSSDAEPFWAHFLK